jgi:hypothetical protein
MTNKTLERARVLSLEIFNWFSLQPSFDETSHEHLAARLVAFAESEMKAERERIRLECFHEACRVLCCHCGNGAVTDVFFNVHTEYWSHPVSYGDGYVYCGANDIQKVIFRMPTERGKTK